MMHSQVEEQEIIERYIRNQLAAEERKAFEEHFFGCHECFEKLQATERFVAGIRDASRRGLLGAGEGRVPVRRISSWWIGALGLSASMAVALAVVSGWLYFVQVPKLEGQLTASVADLRAQQQARASVERQLGGNVQAEGNVPLIMLEATRGVQSPTEAVLPAGAQRLILWMDVSFAKYRDYRLDVYGSDNILVETLEHLNPNSYGALTASLPAQRLQPGEFRIKLSGEGPPPASLLAEYRLKITRP